VKVLVAEEVAKEGLEQLRKHHEVDERIGLTREELCSILPEYDALVVRSQVQVDAELIAAGSRLVVIGRAGVGVDNVDLDAATRAGITVVNAPTGNTIAAAEHTLALLYGVARKIVPAEASLRRGEWKRAQFTGLELRGRTLGIVGLGNIGRELATLARPFGLRLIAHDPWVAPGAAAEAGVALAPLDDLLRQADYVCLCCALTPDTRHLLDAERLALMKKTAYLINVARGPIVDQAALYRALRARQIQGAGLDVFEQEPVPPDEPILGLDNVILAPHALCWTDECIGLNGRTAIASLIDVARGTVPRNVVNRDALAHERLRHLKPREGGGKTTG
jgi:D-3-phosphoglycerate dehydrogenase